jgi:hypothetical protein
VGTGTGAWGSEGWIWDRIARLVVLFLLGCFLGGMGTG